MSDASSDQKSDILKIDQVCDTFESAWRRGEPISIEELTKDFDPQLGSRLLRHLITLEIELRRERNENPTSVEYIARFPAEKQTIEKGFAESTGQFATFLKFHDDEDKTFITRNTPSQTARLSTGDAGRYELLEIIGQGGMGVVHRARDRDLNRFVALKMIRAGFQNDDEARERFFREAKAVALLKHPNIVQIYEIGEWRERKGSPPLPFIALELIEGGSLHERLKGEPQPPKQAAEQIRVLADAMAVAHEQKLIHRDLKPSNVLITSDGTLKLTDFGLVKRAGENSEQTQTGAILGTPSYMAPEQATGDTEKVGPAADIHALGAILYEMLTGRAPYKGATALETMELVRDTEPAPVRSLQPNCPKDLETISLKCLAKDPAKRYPSVTVLSSDLQAFLDGRPIQARPVGSLGRTVKWVKRHPVVTALLAAIVFVSLLGVSGILWQWNEAVTNWRLSQKNEKAATEEARLKGLALNNEKTAKLAEKSARLKAEENAYWGLIQAASGHLNQDNTGLANAALDECPQHLRGFEWHHLKRRCNAHILELNVPGSIVDTFFAADNKSLITVRNVPRENRRFAAQIGLWSVNNGEMLKTWQIEGESTAAALSPDAGQLAVFVRQNPGGITVRDVQSGKELLPIRSKIRCDALAFAQDGNMLVGFHGSRQVTRWDARTGREVARFDVAGPSLTNKSFAFSADGSLFGILDRSGIMHVYDTSSGGEVSNFRALVSRGSSSAVTLRFAADGNHLAFGAQNRLSMQHLTNRRATRYSQIMERGFDQFEFFPNGNLVAIGESNGLTVFDIRLRRRVTRFQGHAIDSRNKAIAISPNGRLVATAGPNIVRVWEMQRSRTMPIIARTDSKSKFSINLNSQWAAAIVPRREDRLTSTLLVWKVGIDRPFNRISVSAQPSRVALHPNGTEAAVVSVDGRVSFYHTMTGKLLRQRSIQFAKSEGRIRRAPFCYSNSGEFFLLGKSEGNDPGKIHLWQTSTEKIRSWTAHKVGIQGVAFLPDEERFLTHSVDGALALWNAKTQKPIRSFQTDSESGAYVGRMRLSSKGRFLAVFNRSPETQFVVWDVESGRKLLTISEAGILRDKFTFSPDEKLLAITHRVVGSHNGTLVFDTSSWKQIHDLPGSGKSISSLAFDHDGKRLFTGSIGIIKVWDLTTGRALMPLTGHQPLGRVDRLVFVPVQKRLIAAFNNEMIMWNGSNWISRD